MKTHKSRRPRDNQSSLHSVSSLVLSIASSMIQPPVMTRV